MSASTIQWTEHTVNPIRARNRETGAVGHFCEKVSPGCTHCYASTWNSRVRPQPSGKLIGTGLAFDVRNREKVETFIDPSKLREVLTRRIPTTYFWCDMTDLFGEWVPEEMIDQCVATMALTPHHTHQVLTKRADRMRAYFIDDRLALRMSAHLLEFSRGRAAAEAAAIHVGHQLQFSGGLPNVWLGVSVENQHFADERIPLLLQTPAAVRFISAEPLLGPVDLQPFLPWKFDTFPQHIDRHGRGHNKGEPNRLDWVIVGGESGPSSRPFDLAWARSIVQQCKAAGVPCFVKQMGANPIVADGRPGCGDFSQVMLRGFKAGKGGNPDEWPEDLRVREFPEVRA